jgi:hypothetical protein
MKNIKELILKGNRFTIKGGLKNIYKIEESENKNKTPFLGKCFGMESKTSMFEACISKINDNSFTYFTFVMDRKASGRIYFKDLTLLEGEEGK